MRPRLKTPANIQLRRAQLTLMLATLVPTIFMLALGILLVAVGSGTEAVVIGVLVLALCTSSLTGYILGSIFVARGALVARFQNDFLSAVSHELRTPLTSIRMFIESLGDERLTDPDERQRCVDMLNREVLRLDGLLDRLISLSRIETGRHEFDRERVRVRDVVDEALIALDAASIIEPAEVVVDVDDSLSLTGDKSALAQALSNLLTNAWKYGNPGHRRITVKAKASDKQVHISVIDNGPGIPKEEQKVIFEHFERGRAAQDSKRQGSGLGLAIARAIVDAHNGRIEVHSEPGKGSEFRIRLPLVPRGKVRAAA